MNDIARIDYDAAVGALALYTPYDAALLAGFKARIPGPDRRWDAARRRWLVAAQHLDALVILCERHGYSVITPSTAVYHAPRIEQRIVRVDYIGAPKERDDGRITAMANSDGEWSLVFPQDVLRGWFEIGGIDTAAPAPTAAMTYYGVLGVKRDADADAMKRAYRQMAKRWHPDINHDPDATEMFKRIGAAYEILADAGKRARYDAGLVFEASLQQDERLTAYVAPDWRPPLRCGWLLVEGTPQVGRFVVSKIIQWQPIVNPAGQELVTSWPLGADTWVEGWV